MKKEQTTLHEVCSRKGSQLTMSLLLPVVVVGGYFYPILGFTVLGLIALFLALAGYKGRFYCGWLCPMGAFHERFLTRISMKRPIPNLFKTSWFRWFVFIAMMSFMLSRLYVAWGDPNAVGGVFRMMWIVSTSIAILLGMYFMPRIWCSICPMGSLQGVVSKNIYLLTVEDSCIQCKKCSKLCPISTYAGAYRAESGPAQVPSIECLRCFNCVENCPKESLSFQSRI